MLCRNPVATKYLPHLIKRAQISNNSNLKTADKQTASTEETPCGSPETVVIAWRPNTRQLLQAPYREAQDDGSRHNSG